MMTTRVTSSLFSKAILPAVAAAAAISKDAVNVGTSHSPDGTSSYLCTSRQLLQRVACDAPSLWSPVTPFGRNFVADAVEKVLPSVVRIEVHVEASNSPGGVNYNQRGSGSGFLVRAKDILGNPEAEKCDKKPSQQQQEPNPHDRQSNDDVLVITNAHCILTPEEFQRGSQIEDEGTKVVYLELSNDRVVTGSIVIFDTDRDVALIRPHGLEENETNVACLHLKEHHNLQETISARLMGTISRSSRPSVRHGEFVAAVGAPLDLENTVTVGIVSNPNRQCRLHPGMTYIQTDNSCHVGNSGGPLVNMDGNVIGITAKKVADGIAYSIPIEDAVETLRDAYYKNKSQAESEKSTVDLESGSDPAANTSTNEDERIFIENADCTSSIPHASQTYSSFHSVPVTLSKNW
jgi:S1-C subfamily serine protease